MMPRQAVDIANFVDAKQLWLCVIVQLNALIKTCLAPGTCRGCCALGQISADSTFEPQVNGKTKVVIYISGQASSVIGDVHLTPRFFRV